MLVIRLAIAALVGLAVGIEREWSGHGITGPHPRFAGVRTFLLLGGIGGAAGWMVSAGHPAIAIAIVAGATGLIERGVLDGRARGRADALDGTTEVAALFVVALGVLAGLGETAVAGGAGALVVLALSEKEWITAAITRLDSTQLRAALQFGVLALVILPVLPNAVVRAARRGEPAVALDRGPDLLGAELRRATSPGGWWVRRADTASPGRSGGSSRPPQCRCSSRA